MRHLQVIALMGASALAAQDAAPLRFEVASVKIAAPSTGPEELGARRGGPGTESPEHISWRATRVGQLISDAYGVKRQQIVGPPWLFQYNFKTILDLQANVARGMTWAEVNAMIRTMLEERFGLKMHREMQERDVYVLSAKPGAKIGGGETLNPSSVEYRMSRGAGFSTPKDGGMLLAGAKMTTADLAEMLEFEVGEPGMILDRTGSTTTHDIALHYSNGQRGTDDPRWPTLFRALEEVGLKLEKKKEFVDILVVDYVATAPTEN